MDPLNSTCNLVAGSAYGNTEVLACNAVDVAPSSQGSAWIQTMLTSASGVVLFFINATVIGNFSVTVNFTNTCLLFGTDCQNPTTNQYAGNLGRIFLWNRTLSVIEVTSFFITNVIPSGLVSDWNPSFSNKTHFIDTVGGNHAVIVGSGSLLVDDNFCVYPPTPTPTPTPTTLSNGQYVLTSVNVSQSALLINNSDVICTGNFTINNGELHIEIGENSSLIVEGTVVLGGQIIITVPPSLIKGRTTFTILNASSIEQLPGLNVTVPTGCSYYFTVQSLFMTCGTTQPEAQAEGVTVGIVVSVVVVVIAIGIVTGYFIKKYYLPKEVPRVRELSEVANPLQKSE